jgi:hypothetical protein
MNDSLHASHYPSTTAYIGFAHSPKNRSKVPQGPVRIWAMETAQLVRRPRA